MNDLDRSEGCAARLNARPALVADPALLALAPFLASSLVYPANLNTFSAAASQYDAPGLCSLVALAVATIVGLALAVHSARSPRWAGFGRAASAGLACAYVLTLAADVMALALDAPLSVLAVLSASSAVPLVPTVLAWVRRFARDLRNAMFYGACACALSALLAWLVSTMPAPGAAACIVVMAAIGAFAPLLPPPAGLAAGTSPTRPDEVEPQGLAPSLRAMLSVIWLPLLGFLVFVFMVSAYQFPTDAPALRTEFVAALIASALALALSLARLRTPLVICVDKLVMPVCVAVCVVLGSFPAGSPLFLLGAQTVLGPLMFLAIYALSALVAMSAAGEFPQPFIVGVGVTMSAGVGLISALVAQSLRDQANFGQVTWVAVVLYCAVVVVWLGYTSWRRETQPRADGPDLTGELEVDDLVSRLVGATEGEDEGADQAARATSRGALVIDAILARRVGELSDACGLTGREEEILMHLARGYSSTYIAQCLLISANTVRTHMRNIYRKLGVSSRSELMELVGREE